jgi:hypothetical protein
LHQPEVQLLVIALTLGELEDQDAELAYRSFLAPSTLK